MVVVCGALGDAVDSLRVLVFSAGGEDGEVREDVVLGMAADPGSVGGDR